MNFIAEQVKAGEVTLRWDNVDFAGDVSHAEVNFLEHPCSLLIIVAQQLHCAAGGAMQCL